MGNSCAGGKKKKGTEKSKTDEGLQSKTSKFDDLTGNTTKGVESVDQFNITPYDLVAEKLGKITKDYTLLNPAIGKGAFGEVRKAIHKASGVMRAVKIINKANTTAEDKEKLNNEVQILRKLDHPNIIKVYEFYQDERYFYIVTELCTGGELFDKIIEKKFFGEKKAADTMRQILSSVFYCHVHKIVHRDLKPENVLYESPKENALIKVIDFGTSRTYDPSVKMNQKFGTPYYIAPEVLKKKYDEKCDIWSCGVILYILLCGFPPFNGPNDKVIMEKVAKGSYTFETEEWKNVSDDAKNFIRKMLEYDPVKRMSAEECLNDPWIQKHKDSEEADRPLMNRALENMRNFRAQRKLQEATWVFLVNYFVTKDEKSELLKTFQQLDKNNDGQLSREELVEGYSRMYQGDKEKARKDVETIFAIVDKNRSGCIDYSEFVMATINKQNLLSKQRLETAFKMFDRDGSGKISLKEIKEVFDNGANIPERVWEDILKQVDANGDGELTFKEFKDMMLKMPEEEGTNE